MLVSYEIYIKLSHESPKILNSQIYIKHIFANLIAPNIFIESLDKLELIQSQGSEIFAFAKA